MDFIIIVIMCQVMGTIELVGSVLRLFGNDPSRHAAVPEVGAWEQAQEPLLSARHHLQAWIWGRAGSWAIFWLRHVVRRRGFW